MCGHLGTFSFSRGLIAISLVLSASNAAEGMAHEKAARVAEEELGAIKGAKRALSHVKRERTGDWLNAQMEVGEDTLERIGRGNVGRVKVEWNKVAKWLAGEHPSHVSTPSETGPVEQRTNESQRINEQIYGQIKNKEKKSAAKLLNVKAQKVRQKILDPKIAQILRTETNGIREQEMMPQSTRDPHQRDEGPNETSPAISEGSALENGEFDAEKGGNGNAEARIVEEKEIQNTKGMEPDLEETAHNRLLLPNFAHDPVFGPQNSEIEREGKRNRKRNNKNKKKYTVEEGDFVKTLREGDEGASQHYETSSMESYAVRRNRWAYKKWFGEPNGNGEAGSREFG